MLSLPPQGPGVQVHRGRASAGVPGSGHLQEGDGEPRIPTLLIVVVNAQVSASCCSRFRCWCCCVRMDGEALKPVCCYLRAVDMRCCCCRLLTWEGQAYYTARAMSTSLTTPLTVIARCPTGAVLHVSRMVSGRRHAVRGVHGRRHPGLVRRPRRLRLRWRAVGRMSNVD